MQRIVVGTITKPQGVKGELKVLPLTDDVERFEELKRIYLDGVGYDVTDARIAPNGVFLQLDGVTTVEQAAALKNCNIEIDRIDAKKLAKGEYFIVDIIGCAVFVGDDKIGVLRDVLQQGSADIYVVATTDKKVAMLPCIKRLVLNVDIAQRKIVLDKTAFEDLVVYED